MPKHQNHLPVSLAPAQSTTPTPTPPPPPTPTPTPSVLTITTSDLGDGVEGAAYSATVSASGGTPSYVWIATGLPGCLTISSDGTISGTPDSAGTSTVTLTVTSEQVIPLLKRYDLDALGKLIGKGDIISGKDVNVDLGYDFWDKLPLSRMTVADDYVVLRATDKHQFTYCPFPPPTYEMLLKARTLHEIMNLLVPVGIPNSETLRTLLDLPITMQDLEKAKCLFGVGLRTAYFLDDRLIWIQCMLRYSGSEVARNMHTPFLESSISFSASPKYK